MSASLESSCAKIRPEPTEKPRIPGSQERLQKKCTRGLLIARSVIVTRLTYKVGV